MSRAAQQAASFRAALGEIGIIGDALADGLVAGVGAATEELARGFADLVSLQGGFDDFASSVGHAMQALVEGVAFAVAQALVLYGVLQALDALFPGAGKFVGATLGVVSQGIGGANASVAPTPAGTSASFALAQTGAATSEIAGAYVVTRTRVGVYAAAAARAGQIDARTGAGSRG
jgi:hypothetical protein